MVDFTMMDKSLKAVWVKRLYEAGDSKWCSLFSSATSQYGGWFLLECNFKALDLNFASYVPSFYIEILTVWQEPHSKDPSWATIQCSCYFQPNLYFSSELDLLSYWMI